MKFLLSVPGHTRTIPMSGFTEKALQQLGHEVVVFNHERNNFSERMREKINFRDFVRFKNQQLMALIEETKPDVFFTIYGKTHDAETVEAIRRKGIKTICWWLNDPFELGYKFVPVQLYDHLLSNSRGTQAVYRHYNARHAAYLPVGVDPTVHRPMPEVEKKYDIVFAGDWHPIREKVLTQLVKDGHNISIIGPWKRKLGKESPLWPYFIRQGYFTPVEMARLFNEARIVYNLHTWYGRWAYGVNPRLFEASGCGAFQLADDKEEIKDLYEDGKEIILYQDVSEVSALLKHYLSDEKRRQEIGHQAHLRTLQSHTYVHRMQELMDICGLV